MQSELVAHPKIGRLRSFPPGFPFTFLVRWRYSLPEMIWPVYCLLVMGVVEPLVFQNRPEGDSVLWKIEGRESVGGHEVEVLGSPQAVGSVLGGVVEFDGADDGLIVKANPLAGLSRFTVEVVFRPDPDGAREQRFLHFQEVDDHRVLIETRLTGDGQWFLDTFLKSGEAEETLFAKEHLHPVGGWFHAALTYDGRIMRHYVNGSPELEGEVAFKPMMGGQTSIGCRMNRVYWFRGAIASVRITPRVLEPQSFSIPGVIEDTGE